MERRLCIFVLARMFSAGLLLRQIIILFFSSPIFFSLTRDAVIKCCSSLLN